MLAQRDRILHSNQGAIAQPAREQPVQSLDVPGVLWTNGLLLDDLPFDQLNPIILAERTGPDEQTIIVDGQQSALQLNGHGSGSRDQARHKKIILLFRIVVQHGIGPLRKSSTLSVGATPMGARRMVRVRRLWLCDLAQLADEARLVEGTILFEDVPDFTRQHFSNTMNGFVPRQTLPYQSLDGAARLLRVSTRDLVLDGVVDGQVQNRIYPVALDLRVGQIVESPPQVGVLRMLAHRLDQARILIGEGLAQLRFLPDQSYPLTSERLHIAIDILCLAHTVLFHKSLRRLNRQDR